MLSAIIHAFSLQLLQCSMQKLYEPGFPHDLSVKYFLVTLLCLCVEANDCLYLVLEYFQNRNLSLEDICKDRLTEEFQP